MSHSRGGGRGAASAPPYLRSVAIAGLDLPSVKRSAWTAKPEDFMAAPTFETLLYAVEDGIAVVTLNRPEKLNAFNTQMMKDMIAVFDETDADDAVRSVIVTGAGRAF